MLLLLMVNSVKSKLPRNGIHHKQEKIWKTTTLLVLTLTQEDWLLDCKGFSIFSVPFESGIPVHEKY